MTSSSLAKWVLYSLLLIAPGGAVGIAGYHFFKHMRGKSKGDADGDKLQGEDSEREGIEAESQVITGCGGDGSVE